ncbi:hypothetical protein C0Q70_13133 [Pomacea canaliculata]|uniref:DRBM domain-containing protein n=1 Tax=Pomacea canaliculata TaxID=400727 RepID=A0A2T7NWE5_POMCA|nr:hypothetical protein C0Q70_13133 [Pomacea canaliculata]
MAAASGPVQISSGETGPESDKEPESEQSISELKAQRERLQREAELLRMAEDEELESQRQKQQAAEDRGCLWGMGEDAMEETEENPFANMAPQHEHLYADDPKKALKGFYEREGYDLPEYQFSEVSFGKHRCFLELPVEGANGEALVAEATVSGKKKEAVVACALEACRLLDMHGILHASKHESRKRKKKNWEDDDFYDSDEDTFLDRTGTIEMKRLFRMKKSGKDAKAETYETLVPKWNEVVNRIGEIENKLQEAKAQADAIASEEDDALDAYMTAIKAGVMDTKTRLTLKRELLTLRTEEQRLRHLVNIAKPASLPVLKKPAPPVTLTPSVTPGTRKIGVARGPKPAVCTFVSQDLVEKESTFEEEDEEEDSVVHSVQPLSKDNQEGQALSKDNQEVQDFSRDLSHISQSQNKANEMIQGSTTSSGPKIKAGLSMSSSPSGKVSPDLHTEADERLGKPSDHGLIVKKQVPVSTEASTKGSLSAIIKSEETKPQVLRLSVIKKKKVLGPPKREYDSSDPDYAVWLPPEARGDVQPSGLVSAKTSGALVGSEPYGTSHFYQLTQL